MPTYRITWEHPTVVVYTSTVEADSEESAIKIANEKDNWERVEMDAFGLCHQCEGNDVYEAEEVE